MMFNWLTSEELTTISLAPGETRLQRLKFIIAFFAATVAAKRARDENEKLATKVNIARDAEPKGADVRPGAEFASGEWVEAPPLP